MKKKILMTKKINNLGVENTFLLNKKINEQFEFKTFLKNKTKSFKKKDFSYSATFNLIYFFSKYWELGNLNNSLYNKYFFKNFKLKTFSTKKIVWIKTKTLQFNNILWEHLFFLKKFFYIILLYKKLNLNDYDNKSLSNLKKWKKNNFFSKNYENEIIKGFLFVWSTKNNFFVTILDYTGNTLVTRTGGNTGWTGTKQRSTVFSADNAMYECCFLAKEWGVKSLIVHIKSSLWLQQIKHCFEGLTVSGLSIESVIYWPIKFFGGCWLKKVRRI